MSDLFYTLVRGAGRLPFWLSSRPVAIDTDKGDRSGAFILAATHSSPYDIPLVIRHTRRPVDFVSITEVFRNPLVGWFYGSLNAFPLERSRPDAPTVRTILDRLSKGRIVCMFPEGGFRKGADSVVYSRKIRSGIGRIALLAGVPIVPVAIVNSQTYSRFTSWLPLRRTRYGIIYGDPIVPNGDAGAIEQDLIEQFVRLHDVLTGQMAQAVHPYAGNNG
jgi:1-acyl-sn-glycerol-3-phosphate acyltransferase